MMTALTTWMLYAALISTLLGVAALAAESAAKQLGRPTRGVWLGALLGSIVLPLVTFIGLPSWLRPAVALPDAATFALPPLVVGGEAAAAGFSPDAWLLAGWATVTLLLACYVGSAFWRLGRARRHWRRDRVEGVQVLVTGNVGPAALGRAILLPEWALAVDARIRRLMLLHEEEHVRARDPALLLAGLAVVVALPWNVALWWQLQRLRLAIELDCDARVLRREPDAHEYGTLLLEMGRRRGGPTFVVAFSEPRAFLERRIRALVTRVRPSARRALIPGVAAGLVLVLAVCAGDPLRPGAVVDVAAPEPEPTIAPDVQVGEVTRAEPAGARALDAQPTFTPMTRAPELINRLEVVRMLREYYPPLLRDAGIGGNPTVWFFIDETGRVTRTQLHRSSGYTELDNAALAVAATMQFSPALNRDRRVPVWVSIPIVFNATAGEAPAREPFMTRDRVPAAAPPPPSMSPPAPAAPTPTTAPTPPPAAPPPPPQVPVPELANPAAVASALERAYPPLLRNAGLGGTATVSLLIDENGRVVRMQLHRTSGHEELDRAALSVAAVMEFAPSPERGSIWVMLPIVFEAR
jgi:TonB family protein